MDFKFQIPTPDTRARYEILRLRLLDLASADLITTPTTDSSEGLAEILAPYESYLLQFSHLEDHPARSLWKIAEKCEELSGRSLHRLPALALALYTKNEPCELKDMMTALAQAVDEEILSIEKMRG